MKGLRLLTTTESKEEEDPLGIGASSLPGTPRALSRRFSDISLLEEGVVKEALCDSHLAPAQPRRRNMVRCHVERVDRHKYYFGHDGSGQFLLSAKLVGTSFYISQYQAFCNTFESESKLNLAPTQAGSGSTFCAVLRLDAKTDRYTLYNRTCEGCDDVYGMHTCGVKSQANGDRQVLAQISHKNFVVNTFGQNNAEEPLVVNGVCVKIPVVYSDLSRDVWCQRTEEKKRNESKRKAFEQRRASFGTGPATPTAAAAATATSVSTQAPTTPSRRPTTPKLGRSKPRVEERQRPRTSSGKPDRTLQRHNSMPAGSGAGGGGGTAAHQYIHNKRRSRAYRSNNKNNSNNSNSNSNSNNNAGDSDDEAGDARASLRNDAGADADADEAPAEVRPMAGSEEGMCEMSTMIPHYDVKTGSLRLRFLGDRVKIASSKNLMFSLDHSSNRILHDKVELERTQREERLQRQQEAQRRELEAAREQERQAEQLLQQQQRGVYVQPHVPQAAGLAHVATGQGQGQGPTTATSTATSTATASATATATATANSNSGATALRSSASAPVPGPAGGAKASQRADKRSKAQAQKEQRRRQRKDAERRGGDDDVDSDSSGDWVEAHRRRHNGERAEVQRLRESCVMQFGKHEDDMYSLDYAFPLAPIQAFAIALSLFQWKGPNKE